VADAPFTDAALASSRYAVVGVLDRYSRNRIFVDEARRSRNVLECGCSNGFLSRLIAAHGGPRVVGIEREREAAGEARAHCDRVLELDLNGDDWPEQVGERFDLVTFGDVLEHLVDPVRTLRQASGLLDAGGRVLVSLPNVVHWTVRAKVLLGRFDYQAGGILDVTHLRFFTRDSAAAMIRQAGYEVVRFTPAVGGRGTLHGRPLWGLAARTLPGLFAFQMIFVAVPKARGTGEGGV
jgi:2-polyprenyl-3-methyl-5-hydroxy-6-metoxy-1,4-benzoquinol methylase